MPGCVRADIDGLVTGYATTLPHLMLATVFAEHFGVKPHYAHAVQLGGATGAAMVMLAHGLVKAGMARNILVVAGENRASGATRDEAIKTLAQVGHGEMEAPLGATVPGYYALLASRYMHEFGVAEADLAALGRADARECGLHPRRPSRRACHRGAGNGLAPDRAAPETARLLPGFGMAPPPLSSLRIPVRGPALRIIGCGQAHQHQHISELADIADTGAAASAARAFRSAGIGREGDRLCRNL